MIKQYGRGNVKQKYKGRNNIQAETAHRPTHKRADILYVSYFYFPHFLLINTHTYQKRTVEIDIRIKFKISSTWHAPSSHHKKFLETILACFCH